MNVAFTFAATPSRHRGETDFDKFVEERRGTWVQDMAEAVARQGCDVSVHMIFPQAGTAEHQGVRWFWCKPNLTSRRLREGKEPSVAFLRSIFCSKPDIIHYQRIGYALNFAEVALLARLRGVPIVAQDHAERSDLYRRGRIVGLPLRIGFRLADMIIFLTPEQHERYNRVFNIPRSCWIANGCAPHFRPIDRAQARAATGMHGDPVIAWVANFHRWKRPMTVLKAFQRITADHPAARLYMIGGGPQEQMMREFVQADERLRSSVELRPFVVNPELPLLYSSADIYVLASEIEGMAVSPIEAMACGSCPVLSDIPSFLFTTNDGETGLHFPVDDDAALADCFRMLIIQPERRRALAEAAQRRAAEHFTWDITARNLVDLYTDIIAKRKGKTS